MSIVDEAAFFSTVPGSFQPAEWRSASGKGVTVAVIDSGIDTHHPDIGAKVIESVEARIENKKVLFDPSSSGDSAGHGTACA
ncbi:MAG: S8 family serine peptidase, partial [Pyrinomonadaceae bacterium]